MEDLIKQLKLTEETKLISEENLSPEVVLFWRCLALSFLKDGKEDELESITPNLTILCNFIRG